jgi:hypothetical protein
MKSLHRCVDFCSPTVVAGLTPVRRPLQSTVRNGTKSKRLCHNGDITKSDNGGYGDYVRM